MIQEHKNLLLAVEEVVAKHTDIKPSLDTVIQASRKALTETKGIEYEGQLTLKYGSSIKLDDMKTDLDDVIRSMVGKRTDIERKVVLSLIIMPEEVKEDADKTAVANKSE